MVLTLLLPRFGYTTTKLLELAELEGSAISLDHRVDLNVLGAEVVALMAFIA